MGKKVIFKTVMVDKFLEDGRIVQEEDKSIIPNLFSLLGIKIKTPEDAFRAAKIKRKIVLLDSENGQAKDLIFEDEEFNYANELIDPKNGRYPDNVNIGTWITPLIEMFRAAEDITLKEDKKSENKDKE